MRMPVVFVGHGSPMNAIENNEYTSYWKNLFKSLKPKAILMVSAHWFTDQQYVSTELKPKHINDMYGFPDELYQVEYDVKGNEILSNRVIELLDDDVSINNKWGIDHGAWSVLVHMFPKADIDVVMLSVNANASPEEVYNIGQKLAYLRDEGYLIIGSGNIVHNLREINFSNGDAGFDYSIDFDDFIERSIQSNNTSDVLSYDKRPSSNQAVPTIDHFYPLLYTLGAGDGDDAKVFNKGYPFGVISMTSYIWGEQDD
jgi:4,5-DOPA dioxygenase extradiol